MLELDRMTVSYISRIRERMIRYISANTTRKYDSKKTNLIALRFFAVHIRRFKDLYLKKKRSEFNFNLGLRLFLNSKCKEFEVRAANKLKQKKEYKLEC